MNLNWGWLWLAWALTGAIIETIALCTNLKNTLSEQLWAVEGNGGTAVRYFVFVFTLWLCLHLTFRLFK